MMKKIFDRLFRKKVDEVSCETRHKCLYFLQYILIPKIVENIRLGKLKEESLFDVNLYKVAAKKIYGKNFFLEWNKFECIDFPFGEEYTACLFTFPKPQMAPEALFGTVLVNRKTKTVAYYTLELAADGDYLLGYKSVDKHFTFGSIGDVGGAYLYHFLIWVGEQSRLQS